jgi:predicted phage terminase large subunit-like protein
MNSLRKGTAATPPLRYTEQEVFRVFLRTDLYAFVQKVFGTVEPGKTFSRNLGTEAITHALDKIVKGEIRRLIINIPPRNLKSICASVALPAFLLGRDPTKKIICVSYSDDLATKFSNDCRAVMRADWYRKTFPRTRIDRAKDTETEVRTTKRGYRLATSVGGTLTGRGGDLIIIDDPIKPDEAQSEAVRKKTIQWYENTLLSRLDDKVHGAIVIVMQRLHMDDLTGHILERGGGGFEHLCLPAIAEEPQLIQLANGRIHIRKIGDVLDPVREPLSAIEKQRDAMTPLFFSAQYQQRPIPLQGNIIKREWLRYFRGSVPHKEGEYYVTSWDTASKTTELNDYSVGTVWLVHDGGKKVYLVDLVRGRFEFPRLIKAAKELYQKWRFGWARNFLIIEDKGSGTALIQALKEEMIYAYPHFMKLDGDKVMRITAQTNQFYAGCVHFKEDAPWLGELMTELLGFPGTRHDDQVDSVSQALAFIAYFEKNRVRVRPVIY